MEQVLKDRLKSFEEPLKHYKEFRITPINSQLADMKRLYEEIGHRPTGSCGACYDGILLTLFDHLIEENLI